MDKLLVSTMLKLVYWDGKQAHILHEGDLGQGTAHYHGITWDNRHKLYVSCVDEFQYMIRRFNMDSGEELPPLLKGQLHETHQIFWFKGLLYMTNTGKNRVEVVNTANPKSEPWSMAWNPSPCDLDHINAIWVDADGVVYVAEHGQKREIGSMVRMCDLTLNELATYHTRHNIHNVYAEDGWVYNLTSPHDGNSAGLLRTDAHGVERIDFPEWGKSLLRGLARTQDNWYIGMSRWERDRSNRAVGDAVVVQLDNSFQEVDRITMEDFGPVCSVRALGVVDLAHNRIVAEVGQWT